MSKLGIFGIVLGILAVLGCLLMFFKKSENPSPVPTNEPVVEETILPEEGK